MNADPMKSAMDRLKIIGLVARAVRLPMKRPLVTGAGPVSEAPFVLIDLEVSGGLVGHAYVGCYHAFALKPLVTLLDGLRDAVVGEPAAPRAVQRKLLKSLHLLGWQGLTGMALSGIDMACWDVLAKSQGLPLCTLLGGTPGPVPAYNSKGMGLSGPESAGDAANELLAEGFSALKVRLGYPDLETDVAVIEAVLEAVPSGTRVMSDYNQCLTVPEAQRRIQALDGAGLDWVEEPTLFNDYTGHARIRNAVSTPIQTGENCWYPEEVAKAFQAGVSDVFMPDLGKVGGVTGWLAAMALAETHAIPLSSHLYPEVSAHVLRVTPTCHWLECVDWADPVLQEPLAIKSGEAVVPDRPGNGLAWDEKAVERYAA